jgi:hypothetical protein
MEGISRGWGGLVSQKRACWGLTLLHRLLYWAK